MHKKKFDILEDDPFANEKKKKWGFFEVNQDPTLSHPPVGEN